LLSSFVILSFADLKKYKFSYWFAFPAIHSDPPWIPARPVGSESDTNTNQEDPSALQAEHLSSTESNSLVEAVQTWSYSVDDRQRGFFLARKQKPDSNNSDQNTWRIASLSEYENGFFNGAALENRYVCFADPSNYEKAPGWMLRNLLVLVRKRWGLNQVQILRYRDTQSKRDEGRSMVFSLQSSSEPTKEQLQQSQLPKITGWERNPAGKLSGRTVSLAEYMDPTRFVSPDISNSNVVFLC
jgi:ubiquitin-like modifier-activating enzyme ATG7